MAVAGLPKEVHRCTVCHVDSEAAPFYVQHVAGFDADIPMFNCPSCGGVYSLLPKDFPLAQWYAESPFYGEVEYAAHHGDAARDFRFQAFFAIMAKQTLSGSLLDVGAGEGDFLRELKSRGWQGALAGLDLHEERATRMAGEIPITHGRLEDFVREGGARYDVVTIFDTVEHFPEPADTLEALKNVMAPDGWLFLSVPNSERIRLSEGWEIFDYPPNHVTRWNKEVMRAFLSARGFSVVAADTSFPWPRCFGEQLFYFLYAPAVRFAKLFLHRTAPVSTSAGAAPASAWSGPLADQGLRAKIEVALLRVFNVLSFPFLLPVSLLLPLLRPRSGTHLFVLARRKSS
jgi:2-polyprenyl-3-methyl-5-hydroxy-6-metoxy-1,4-benzoquinol methylase